MRVGLPCPVGNSGSNYHGPMCCRTVSLWIIHGLCSSLTQEHWRQQWIMFTLICALKHLWTWLAVKKLTNGNKRQKQWRMGRALRVCLIVCGLKMNIWLYAARRRQNTAMWKEIYFFSIPNPPLRIWSIFHPLIMLTCSNQSYANRKVCCFVNLNSRGKSRCEKWNGNWVYSMGSAAATLCRPSQREPEISQDDFWNCSAVLSCFIDNI